MSEQCPEAEFHGKPFRYCPVKGCGWIEPTPPKADPVDLAMAVMDAHRWKTMGVSSVTCECGEILYGDESLTQFPADEAFLHHVASLVVQAIQADA